jgi:hypothetical protein
VSVATSVKYTNIFLSRVCRDLRRDLGAGLFFMARMVHRRNGEPNDVLGYTWYRQLSKTHYELLICKFSFLLC